MARALFMCSGGLSAKPPSRSSSLNKSRTSTPESSDDDTAPSPVQSAWTFEKFVVGLDDADPFIVALVDVLVKVRHILRYNRRFRGFGGYADFDQCVRSDCRRSPVARKMGDAVTTPSGMVPMLVLQWLLTQRRHFASCCTVPELGRQLLQRGSGTRWSGLADHHQGRDRRAEWRSARPISSMPLET
jgi:hypothetical protein